MLSNVIMFLSGLDPVFGFQLNVSEHVKDIANTDADILQYREKVIIPSI